MEVLKPILLNFGEKAIEFISLLLKKGLSLFVQFIRQLASYIIDNVDEDIEHKYSRCTHNVEYDPAFNELLLAHDNAINNPEQHTDPNQRAVITTDVNNPVDLGTTTVTIDIPMAFHLLDPVLNKQTVSYWSNHITTKIIPQLNADYNRTYKNYSATLTTEVNRLFAKADPIKKQFYLNVVNTLPKNSNLVWNFSLNKVIIKPVSGLNITGDDENIYRAATLIDPETVLNIVVAPGSQILGISVFPFSDRDPSDPSKIDPDYKYRNSVLINTAMFIGKTKPYDKFRTFTHEIGHWAGLLHPFDNQSYISDEVRQFGLNKLNFDKTPVAPGAVDQDFVGDLIADTVTQFKPTYGTVVDTIRQTRQRIGGIIKTVTTHIGPYASIFMNNSDTPNFYNFMDYTDDGQMCMFTQLQVLHMVYMLMRFRPKFVKS